jgi:hypothetical protein
MGALAGLLLPARALNGQIFTQLEQVEEVQRTNQLEGGTAQPAAGESVPPLYSGEEADSGRQLLLETAPQAHWDWFNLNLDSQYFYTSNALLSDTGRKPTGLLVSSADAALAAPPFAFYNGQLSLRAGYQYQWFNYGLGGPGQHLSDIDFDAATTYLESEDDLPDNWSIYANLSYTRLLSEGNDYDEFYKELVPTLALQKNFQIRPDMQLSLDYSGNFRFTDEPPFPSLERGANNRTDQSLDLILAWQVTPKLLIRPFYRFQYSFYPDYYAGHTRNDVLNTLGVSANYCFNSWSSIRLFLTYDVFSSDAASVPDYRKLDAGGGVTVGLKF